MNDRVSVETSENTKKSIIVEISLSRFIQNTFNNFMHEARVCARVPAHVCGCTCARLCVHVLVSVTMHVCGCTHVYVCACVHTHMCTNVCVRVDARTYVKYHEYSYRTV